MARFSLDREITAAQFVRGTRILYAITLGGLGWLLLEMHALDVNMAAIGERMKSVEARLLALEEKANKIDDGLGTVKSTELAYLRERIGKAETKLECVTCAGIPFATISTGRGERR